MEKKMNDKDDPRKSKQVFYRVSESKFNSIMRMLSDAKYGPVNYSQDQLTMAHELIEVHVDAINNALQIMNSIRNPKLQREINIEFGNEK